MFAPADLPAAATSTAGPITAALENDIHHGKPKSISDPGDEGAEQNDQRPEPGRVLVSSTHPRRIRMPNGAGLDSPDHHSPQEPHRPSENACGQNQSEDLYQVIHGLKQ